VTARLANAPDATAGTKQEQWAHTPARCPAERLVRGCWGVRHAGRPATGARARPRFIAAGDKGRARPAASSLPWPPTVTRRAGAARRAPRRAGSSSARRGPRT
jgi:hypothetical protein